MTPNREPIPTPEEERLLRHEWFIAEVARQRKSEPSPSAERKSSVRIFIESAGGAALISVLFTAVAGNWIVAHVQDRNRKRDLERQAHKEYLDGRQKMVTEAYDLLGKCLAAAENLEVIDRPEWRPRRYPGKQADIIAKQVTGVIDYFNTLDQQWRNETEALGLKIGFYYPGKPVIVTAWHEVRSSVSDYMDCERSSHMRNLSNPRPNTPPTSCSGERNNVTEKINGLTKQVQAARDVIWEEPPKRSWVDWLFP